MDKNFWFAFDSKCLFDDKIHNKLAIYSYDQLCKLYEGKMKNKKATFQRNQKKW
jgi:hypothetical protein